MSEIRHNTPQERRETRGVAITNHTIEPKGGLELPAGDVALLVTDGLLYVALEDDDLALIPGDEIVIPAGNLQFAWNPTTDTTKVAALRR
jgi:quercetin dioxygenase-like cupin family protein